MRILLVLAALLFAPAAHAQTLENLAWLKGCWRTSGDGPVITEVWSAPPMPALVGYAYTIENGALQSWEQTRIELVDGVATFVAMPNGGAPVRFALVETSIGGALFENTAHDFPQRVGYLRDGNRLTATISLADGSNAMSFEYRRISCTSALRP